MSAQTTADRDLVRLVDDFFPTEFGPDIVQHVEDNGLNHRQWAAVTDLGLSLIGIDESAGGSGGSLLDLVAVLGSAGRTAAPLPIAESYLAAWLLTSAGADPGEGRLAVVPDSSALRLEGGRLVGHATQVPWAAGASLVVALAADGDTHRVVSFEPGDVTVTPGRDLAGMPSDRLDVDLTGVDARSTHVTGDDLFLRGALVRSAQMAGAMTGALEMTRTYTGQRVQFGRPISAFQSVQAHVVALAQAATVSTLSVHRAAMAAARGPATLEIVATKSVANRCSASAVQAAHQAHGAIGLTREYPLQQLTRRLNTWRREFGQDLELDLRLGRAMATSGGMIAAATSPGSTVEV